MIDLLRARVARGSRAPHGDGARIALAVEGGAMRGVISAGMVWALEDLGLIDAFDAVYGSSAGAINAAYFLGGQAGLGTTIYHEDINNRHFIDLSRMAFGRPVVDLGYMLDHVAVRLKPLDTARVLASPSPFSVIATDVGAEGARALGGFTTPAQLMSALRASATMPVLAGAPHVHDGRAYLDASISEPIPVPTAERDGHTHVLVLLTRTGPMRRRPTPLDRYFVGPRLKRLSSGLAASYLTRAVPYAALIDQIDAGTGPMGQARVMAIRSTCRISRLERRRDVLKDGARQGYDAVMAAFRSASF